MKSIDDLVALAKKKPDGLNFGSPGVGTPSHLAAEKLMVAKGIKAQFVHYKGGAPMMTDLIAGRLDAAWPSAPLARSFIQNEKIKAIALDGAQRWKLIPDVPTLREVAPLPADKAWIVDLREKIGEAQRAMVAAPGVPADRINYLRSAFAKILTDPAVIAEGARTNRELEYMSGTDLQAVVAELMKAAGPRLPEFKKIVLDTYF